MSSKISKTQWIGRGLSLIPILIFSMSIFMKLSKNPGLLQQMNSKGISENLVSTIVLLEIISLCLYIFPRTAFLGAILLTGYLGGAIFAHLRVGEAVTTQIILGLLIWGGLYLRDNGIKSLIPIKSKI